ncbi:MULTISPECIES: CvpA family protein [unclassified Helicobacter]|uniref:CvpA family protein n=1 Tax=unclassified Helicobacter TaxID=2593540 RepID=UPI000CF03B9C|nr:MULTISPECIES: CvpA family protein [unclassified Helicobacter]
MSYVDIVVLALVLILGARGFLSGLIHEVATLIGIVAGIFFASRLSGEMAVFFNQHIYNINSSSASLALGFIIVLSFFWIGFMMIGIVFSKLIRFTSLSLLDRLLGFVFSCVKSFCILSCIIYGISEIKFVKEIDFMQKLPQQSKIYDAMLDTARIIVRFDSVKEVEEKMQGLNKKVQKSIEQIQEKIQAPLQ